MTTHFRQSVTGSPLVAGLVAGSLFFGCSSQPADRDLTVVGTDYAFTVADTVPAGRTRIAFTNRGLVRHELSLARLKPGVTLADVMRAQQEGKSPGDFLIGAGVLIAEGGETDPIALSADLAPGERYAMVCFFSDSAGAPPHVALGMMKEFVVAAR